MLDSDTDTPEEKLLAWCRQSVRGWIIFSLQFQFSTLHVGYPLLYRIQILSSLQRKKKNLNSSLPFGQEALKFFLPSLLLFLWHTTYLGPFSSLLENLLVLGDRTALFSSPLSWKYQSADYNDYLASWRDQTMKIPSEKISWSNVALSRHHFCVRTIGFIILYFKF